MSDGPAAVSCMVLACSKEPNRVAICLLPHGCLTPSEPNLACTRVRGGGKKYTQALWGGAPSSGYLGACVVHALHLTASGAHHSCHAEPLAWQILT